MQKHDLRNLNLAREPKFAVAASEIAFG